MRRLLYVASVLFAFANSTSAQDFQILYPDQSVSSRPIVEFRARSAGLAEDEQGRLGPSVGHAYIAFGREIDNGTTVFYGIAGFYPEPGGNPLQKVKNILNGPGEVSYKFEDTKFDMKFRLPITELQARELAFVVNNWDEKKYNLAFENCVHLMKLAANYLGLKYDGSSQTPAGFLEDLVKQNNADAALVHAGKVAAVSDARYQQELVSMRQHIDDQRRAREEEARRRAQQELSQQIGGGGIPQNPETRTQPDSTPRAPDANTPQERDSSNNQEDNSGNGNDNTIPINPLD